MRIIKPDQVSLLTRVLEIKSQSYFVTTALLGFNLNDPTAIWTDTQMWSTMMKSLEGEKIIGGFLRPVAEVLMIGSGRAPHGRPLQAHRVRLAFGQVDKTLYVFGDRRWKKGISGPAPSDPLPFTIMPLGYERAFGGPTCKHNPLGLGHDPLVGEDGREFFPLPNIEDPRHLIASPADRPDPAGFGPLDQTWPQRAAKCGTFNEDWLKKYWPSFPEDFDWYFFNKAPKDQWLAGWPNGDEAFTLEGVHPDGPIVSRLPGKKIRLFITRGFGNQESFSEIALHIDTVWFFPDQNFGMLCFRGSIPVQDDEASEIAYLYTSIENLSAPRLVPLIYQDFKERTAPPKPAAEPEPTIPATSPEPEPSIQAQTEAAPPALSPEEAQAIQEMEAKLLAAEKDLAREMEKRGLNYEEIVKLATAAPPSPPPPSLAEAEALLAQALKEAGLDALPVAPTPPPLEEFKFDPRAVIDQLKGSNLLTPELEKEIWRLDQELQSSLKELAKAEASKKEEAEKDQIPSQPALTREELLSQYSRGRRNFAGLNLAGLNLSRADLTDIDLTRANLTQTDFTESILVRAVLQEAAAEQALFLRAKLTATDLTRANFTGANLTGADLSNSVARETVMSRTKAPQANFKGTCLEGAVLITIDLTQADLSQANLTGAVATQAAFPGASLVRARLEKTDFSDSNLVGADLSEAQANQADFSRADLSGARFLKSQLERACLDKTTLTAADFSQVKAPSLSLHGANGEKVIFRSAQLENLRADEFTALPGSDFSGAQLPLSYFGRSELSRTKFTQARLDGTTFHGCRLANADFHLARAVEARFLKCDLTETTLERANLLFASLARSKCLRTDLRGANLFGVDTIKTEFLETNVLNANLKRTRIPGRT